MIAGPRQRARKPGEILLDYGGNPLPDRVAPVAGIAIGFVGDAVDVLVLRKGSDAELSSNIEEQSVGLILAASLAGSAAFAVGVTDEIVRQLQADGYTDIVLEKTWLGRIRIRAISPSGTREIIVNPSTGEILRDLWIVSATGSKASTLIKDPAVTPPKSDDGTKGGTDDDKEDDAEDDDEDDSSDDSEDDDGEDD
mgnify:CR=1 FL=1